MVFDAEYSHDIIREQRKVALLQALFGWIPLSIGSKIRRYMYRSLVGKMGQGVTIGVGFDMAGAKGIFLEEKCAIEVNGHLDCWDDDNSRITLRTRSRLDQGAHLQALGGHIEIGEGTYIGPYFCAAGPGNIRIGKHCMIASHSSMYANNHVFSDPTIIIGAQGVTAEGIVIEEDCWLGTGVRVLDGVTIGRGSVIGAGAVVTKDIPPFSIAVGVPAKVIAKRGAERSQQRITPVPS